jgi:NAD(P)-dependent dehydrogenase (short-subunit alcohol dehydrogenase family)
LPKSQRARSQHPALRGKIALITGASRGIGLAIAHALAAEGCDLVVTGRKLDPLRRTGRELARHGVRVLVKACDVRDPASVKALGTSVRKQFSRVGILVNNAGIGQPSLPVAKLPYSNWKDVIDTNLTGTFLVTREILPLMRRGGAIVNNLSIAATQVFPNSSAYNASKHGALGLTNTLREELRSEGIRVIALLPGATDTEIWNAVWPDAPRKKMMSAETVARAVVSALLLPENSTVEELRILPTAGVL